MKKPSQSAAAAAPEPRPGAAAAPRHPRLPDQITVGFGPAGLLGRFFLKADAAARARGVTLSLAPVQQLVETNLSHSATWRPLLPLFNPAVGGITDETGLCIIGRNAEGEIVATQGARLYDWSNSNFHEAATSLRMFYADPERQSRPGEQCRVSAPSARDIRGRVVLSGAGWYRPDHRGRLLSSILPRISRALAYTRWQSDYTIGLIAEPVVSGGMARRAGFTNVEPSVELIASPVGDRVCCALVWMQPTQLFDDLAEFLSDFDAQVDAGIHHRRA